ncbi:MAG: crossover junction endodeoxyribonuclease RuvC, partial [Candidatus Cloacimonetes bacterium]|nr:crossover junction endodeoxyribonuclease RuvC [Candidatus Cloacimonadota bacterium]
MIILGVDPGSRNCGVGILETNKNKITAAGCDVIKLNVHHILPLRLSELYDGVIRIINQYKPDIAVVETIFYGKNISSSFVLGHARGVILLAIAQSGIQLFEYSPKEVKKALVGNGNATKKQIRYMVKHMLNIDLSGKSDDATDALAIAVCQFNRMFITNLG